MAKHERRVLQGCECLECESRRELWCKFAIEVALPAVEVVACAT